MILITKAQGKISVTSGFSRKFIVAIEYSVPADVKFPPPFEIYLQSQ